jgi:hypothetical protein
MGTLPTPPAPPPSSEEERIKRRARTVFLVVAGILAVAGLTAVLFIGVSLYSLFDLGHSSPQPDAPLVTRFQGHREAFQELLLLAWKDDGRDPGGRRVREVAERPSLDAGERRRYRQLRRELGIDSVLTYNGEADFATASWGIVPSGWEQGYTWRRDAASPLVDDTQDNDSSGEYVYRRLGGHWYLFYGTW